MREIHNNDRPAYRVFPLSEVLFRKRQNKRIE